MQISVPVNSFQSSILNSTISRWLGKASSKNNWVREQNEWPRQSRRLLMIFLATSVVKNTLIDLYFGFLLKFHLHFFRNNKNLFWWNRISFDPFIKDQNGFTLPHLYFWGCIFIGRQIPSPCTITYVKLRNSIFLIFPFFYLKRLNLKKLNPIIVDQK